ncbi:MAG: heparinase II/III family protein [Armatimonadetes bacterium]|nr:heparinase II/III family protein [Armatimonadota bacterium]
MRWIGLLAIMSLGAANALAVEAGETPAKTRSVFYPSELIERARRNSSKEAWAASVRKQIVEAAQPWMRFSDDELWSFMFGNTIKRSWMVWSNGYCPACRQPVPMYNWGMDALNNPWKVRCPHCQELFPKNDFGKYYQSGLDEHNIFDPQRADRSLLFNTDHPNPDDLLHDFGVDDGEGYVGDNHRWRFIGAYLIYGQWKQAVFGGVQKLSAAYTITGEKKYSHKAAVLLDRVADLYPTFDFGKEGVMYEGPPSAGYISTWHDACEETRELALAFDQIFEALDGDPELVSFLSQKAAKFGLANSKSSVAAIRGNIEDRLLKDALRNRGKIHSNYPRTEIAIAIIKTVLGWPENRTEVYAALDPMIDKATAVDGVTGEKGLAGYSSFTIQGLAMLLGLYSRLEPSFLHDCLGRHPQLRDTYRFFIDTWCQQQYYPQSGDTGAFAHKGEQYVGVIFSKSHGMGAGAFNFALAPSMYSFLWDLYESTGDKAYVQVLYHANGGTVKGLPCDLFAADPGKFQQSVRQVIAAEGPVPKVGSINKQQWHLGLLRSGKGKDARDLWLDYDSGGGHGHADGMNLGLFAKGLDLMPEFGYPPVHYGGWGSPRASWYTMTAAHNTVVVDGQNTRPTAGKTTLWAQGQQFKALRTSGPDLIGGKQYERTVALVDLSPRDSYILDVFRVVGGADHAKFTHSHFGALTAQGLNLKPAPDYGHNTQMRNFSCDPSPAPSWSADWKVEDRFHYLPANSDVHLRYFDLTTGAEAWIPCVVTHRQGKQAPLSSTFVSLLEPYEKVSSIAAVRRLPLESTDGEVFPDANVAVEVQLVDGRRDCFMSADVENPLGLAPTKSKSPVLSQKDWRLQTDCELVSVRLSRTGQVQRIAMCRGRFVTVGEVSVRLKKESDLVEVKLEKGRASVVAGDIKDVDEILIRGRIAFAASLTAQ